MIMQNYFFFRKPESIVKEMFACVSVYFFCVDFAIRFTLFCFCIFYFITTPFGKMPFLGCMCSLLAQNLA